MLPAEHQTVGQGFSVGLHWRLLDTPYHFRIPVEDLLARSVALQVAGQDVATLAPEDQLVYACGHLALHHLYDEALSRYYELAWGLLRAWQAFDWGAVLQRTQEWRLVLPAQRVLERLEGLWPGLMPSEALDLVITLTPSRSERFVHRWVVAETGNPAVRAILAWLTMPGFGRRWRYALEHAFPGPDYMTQRYGAAPGGRWPLLYLRRIGLATRHAITAAAGLLRRSSKHTPGADVARQGRTVPQTKITSVRTRPADFELIQMSRLPAISATFRRNRSALAALLLALFLRRNRRSA
jgi:hypothetical protein